MLKIVGAACVLVLLMFSDALADNWKPASGPLMTRWAKDVSPNKVLPEYPRPQMVRKEWQNLNGMWDYAIRPKDEGKPEKWDGKILVPFCAESALSGVMKSVGKDKRLWYRRTFSIPESWKGGNVLLHFGAVDWETTVWVNGTEIALGTHRGGYDPFSFEIGHIVLPMMQNEIVVSVWDPTDAAEQPRGKQLTNPHGIWYTPVTGIWQTVWIEPVGGTYIASLRIDPDVDAGGVRVDAAVEPAKLPEQLDVEVLDGEEVVGRGKEESLIKLQSPKLWTPETPFLYRLRIGDVESYFAMRKISLGKDDKGVLRLMLNNKPVFHLGPLDQGWWPDGLYTAPTDEALKYDIEATKRLGFNMIRKHTKLEPERWYYWADKLGILVWQDMVSGFSSEKPFAKWDPVGTFAGTEGKRSDESRKIYDTEFKAMVDALYNHPSIVMWVPFNEGWGQFDTMRVTNWIKQYDPTRLVNCASGGNDFPVGDVKDLHNYPGPAAPKPDGKRAIVLGEFGGLGLPVDGHTWQSKDNWGYRKFQNVEELSQEYRSLFVRLRRLIDEPGLAAAVYTQTTDVEGEVNGLMTYDRAVVKIPEEQIREAHALLSAPPAQVRSVIPDARKEPLEWKYTIDKPRDGWEAAGFDDATWKSGPAGFGTQGTPGAVVRTLWNTPDVWIRRTFELPADVSPKNFYVMIHHDEDAEVYLNGVLAAKLKRYTTEYGEQAISPEAKAALKPGAKNVIAIHCKQTGGGQYVDAGIVEISSQQKK
jgi:hypothetical protein